MCLYDHEKNIYIKKTGKNYIVCLGSRNKSLIILVKSEQECADF